MSRLLPLERAVQRYVDTRDPTLTTLVESSATLAAAARLDVYADAYRLRLLEVLGKDFAALRHVVGEARFESLARAYIETSPSHHFNIRWYGQDLAAFLRNHPDSEDREMLGEIAAWEWAMGLVFDAPDDDCAGPAEIGAVRPEAWPEMLLVPVRSLRRLDLHWNAPALRKAVDEDAELPSVERSIEVVPWLLWRRELVVHYRRLDCDEACALDAVQRASDFAGICEVLYEQTSDENVAVRVAGMLKRWLQDGVIARIETSSTA